MENNKLSHFSESERAFATANHNLIKSFLHRFGYDMEEYYSIVVPGYLKAVQVYHRRENLRKQYSFQCISYQYMRSEIGNYIKATQAKKRRPAEIIISLDAEYADNETLYNCIGGKSLESEIMEAESITELLENFSDIQRHIIKLKMDGYKNKEICVILGIGATTFYKELRKIKDSLMENLVM